MTDQPNSSANTMDIVEIMSVLPHRYPFLLIDRIVEAIAQTGAALLLTEYTAEERDSKLMVFTGIDSAKFRRPVVPGDQLRIEVTVLNWRSNAVRMRGVATVEGKIACEAIVMCALTSRTKSKPAPTPEPPAAPAGAATE